jgi:YHS domain-containing protein
MFKRLIAAVMLVSLLSAAPALAGEGTGAINDVTVVALGGFDAVAYFEGKPKQGLPKFSTTYQGLPYLFASAAHRDAFAADPAKYAPEFGGFCAIAAAFDDKATIDPNAYVVFGDKLYVTHSMGALEFFKKDLPGNIAKAKTNWPHVQTIPGPTH